MRHLLLALALSAASAAAAQPLEGFDLRLADLINRYRQSQGLAPLAVTQDLVAIAGEHSAAMASRGRLTHDGFQERFRRTGRRICVENVGWNHATAEALMEGWRHSPAHLRNLLEPGVSQMGVAGTSRYFTFFACH